MKTKREVLDQYFEIKERIDELEKDTEINKYEIEKLKKQLDYIITEYEYEPEE